MGVITFKEYEDGSIIQDRLGINNLILAYSGTPSEIYNKYGLYTDHIVLDISPLLMLAPNVVRVERNEFSEVIDKVFNFDKFVGKGGYSNACFINLFEQMFVHMSCDLHKQKDPSELLRCIGENALSEVVIDGMYGDVVEIGIDYRLPNLTYSETNLLDVYLKQFRDMMLRIMSQYGLDRKSNILEIEDDSYHMLRVLHDPSLMKEIFHIKAIECKLDRYETGVGYGRAIIRCWNQHASV